MSIEESISKVKKKLRESASPSLRRTVKGRADKLGDENVAIDEIIEAMEENVEKISEAINPPKI